MGRDRKYNLQPFKEEIEQRRQAQHTTSQILLWLSGEGADIKRSQYYRALKEWDMVTHKSDPQEIPGFDLLLQDLTYRKGLSDSEISIALRDEFDCVFAPHTVRNLRLRRGFLRRDMLLQRQALLGRWKVILEAEFARGILANYGRRLLHAYFRREYPGMQLGQRSLYELAREIDPDGAERRLRAVNRRRGAYLVPGPNYIWSIDGHCKLEQWGFEIYGCIDAYSRFIVFAHCGYTARTAYSTMVLYLNAVRNYSLSPMIIRSDKGVETLMLANLHHTIALQDWPDLPFESCYCYGTSTSNQRIESWWAQWTRTKGHAWGDYFRELQRQNLWTHDSIIDRVALLAVFMPILQDELKEFVDTWNFHKIRKQKNRPWVIHGKPWMNYYYPQQTEHATGLDYGTRVEAQLLQETQQYVDRGPGKYHHGLPSFSNLWWTDISTHLPPHTQELCNRLIFESVGEDLSDVASSREWLPQQETRRFDYRYRQLRDLLAPHHDELELLPKPTKSSGLIPEELIQCFGGDIDNSHVQELDLEGVDAVEERDVDRAFQQQLQDLVLDE